MGRAVWCFEDGREEQCSVRRRGRLRSTVCFKNVLICKARDRSVAVLPLAVAPPLASLRVGRDSVRMTGFEGLQKSLRRTGIAFILRLDLCRQKNRLCGSAVDDFVAL
jgi:hypothetical protein